MSDSLFKQTIFSLYEIFSNIIPGLIILITINIIISVKPLEFLAILPEFSNNLNLFLWIILMFIIGMIVQEFGSKLEKAIFRLKKVDYPSTKLLDKKDETIPSYLKNELDVLLQEKFNTPINSEAQHVFDLCYRYVVQNNVSERTIRFLYMYTFCRNMIATLIIESFLIFFISYYVHYFYLSSFGIFTLLLIIPFYNRFNQFGFSFSKEVIYSCYLDMKKNS